MKKAKNPFQPCLIIASLLIVCTFQTALAQPAKIYSDSLPFNPIIRDKFTADAADEHRFCNME